MATKSFRPLTPSLRYTVRPDYREITKSKPEKSLTEPRKRTGGRNVHGRLTSRHRGGGHKRRYRLVDFKRRKQGIAAVVQAIEYDPNRTARLALLKYADGELAYIIAPNGLKVGDSVQSGPGAEPRVGNFLPLRDIPAGTTVHNIEIIPGRGGQIARSAGVGATLMGFDGEYAQLRMPSSEIRRVHNTCCATVGQVGNLDHENTTIGKAGRARWMGVRPTVRGMVMNPIDHPNGGGQGKSKGGGGWQHLTSPWGQVARGLKTRRKSKPSNKFVVERRKK
jgi:large subunit ribosomal protein L2